MKATAGVQKNFMIKRTKNVGSNEMMISSLNNANFTDVSKRDDKTGCRIILIIKGQHCNQRF